MPSNKLFVELYYDVVSPYTYFAFEVLCRYRRPWNLQLELKPFFLPGLMKAAGNTSPATVANKQLHGFKDLQRLARYYGLPLRLAHNYMELVMTKNTLPAMRFLCAVQLTQPSNHLEQLTRKFYERFFGEGKEIMSTECVPEVARSAGLFEAEIGRCLDLARRDPEVKDLLKRNTNEALALDAIGAPFIVAHIDGRKETFFGQDRIELLGYVANKKWLGPTPPQD